MKTDSWAGGNVPYWRGKVRLISSFGYSAVFPATAVSPPLAFFSLVSASRARAAAAAIGAHRGARRSDCEAFSEPIRPHADARERARAHTHTHSGGPRGNGTLAKQRSWERRRRKRVFVSCCPSFFVGDGGVTGPEC